MRRLSQKDHTVLELLFCVLFSALLGCDGGDGGDGSGDGGSVPVEDAGQGEEYDSYVPGLEKEGSAGEIKVRLQGAQPAPPEEGENTWTLEVVDADGVSVDGASVTMTPWMPAHGHGTNPASYTATEGEDSGTYELGPFILTMPGLWELTIKVLQYSVVNDEVKYAFMIEG